jgi:hypothetical protein
MQDDQPAEHSSRSRRAILRRALWANAAFSTLTGALITAIPAPIASALELASPLVIRGVGVGLLGFGALVALVARRDGPDARPALCISLADLGWVVSTTLFALAHGVSVVGAALVLVSNSFVASFALAQFAGIERSFRVRPNRALHRVCIEHRADASAEALWSVVSNVGEIARFIPSLRYSKLRDGRSASPGAVRECESHTGHRWAERVERLDHAERSLVVEFLATEPGFPYPFASMRGGWSLAVDGEQTRVTVWWETTPKAVWHTALLLPMMASRVRSDFVAIIDAMADEAAGRDRRPLSGVVAAAC